SAGFPELLSAHQPRRHQRLARCPVAFSQEELRLAKIERRESVEARPDVDKPRAVPVLQLIPLPRKTHDLTHPMVDGNESLRDRVIRIANFGGTHIDGDDHRRTTLS